MGRMVARNLHTWRVSAVLGSLLYYCEFVCLHAATCRNVGQPILAAAAFQAASAVTVFASTLLASPISGNSRAVPAHAATAL